jgi:hypothetical protein
VARAGAQKLQDMIARPTIVYVTDGVKQVSHLSFSIHIPEELKATPQWLVWQYGQRREH